LKVPAAWRFPFDNKIPTARFDIHSPAIKTDDLVKGHQLMMNKGSFIVRKKQLTI